MSRSMSKQQAKTVQTNVDRIAFLLDNGVAAVDILREVYRLHFLAVEGFIGRYLVVRALHTERQTVADQPLSRTHRPGEPLITVLGR